MFAIAAQTVWTGSLTTWLRAQTHGDAAQNIGMDGTETPAADEQIDHARSGGTGSVGEIGTGSTTTHASAVESGAMPSLASTMGPVSGWCLCN